MIKALFILLLCLHGLIHLIGFAKAFNLAPVSQLTSGITRTAGLLWLLTTVLFTGSTILFIWNKNIWWMPAVLAVSLSQILIFISWQDAKYGSKYPGRRHCETIKHWMDASFPVMPKPSISIPTGIYAMENFA